MIDIEPSLEQRKALDDILGTSADVFLTGQAGSGKSTILKYLGKRIPLTISATTGAAALNVGGCTVDSLFSINREHWEIRDPNKLFKNMNRCSRDIVIDEASMVGSKMADLLRQAARDTRKRLILVGDMAQASPVKDSFAVHSRLFREAKVIKLMECHRQADAQMLEALNHIRVGNTSLLACELFGARAGKMPDDDTYLRIYATNATTSAYNNRRLAMLDTPSFTLQATYEDLRPSAIQEAYPMFANQAEKHINDSAMAHNDEFKLGARVILRRNVYKPQDAEEDAGGVSYVNGDAGVIVAVLGADGKEITEFNHVEHDPFSDEPQPEAMVISGIIVHLDRTDDVVVVYQSQQDVHAPSQRDPIGAVVGFPIMLGWSVTIHRCQGMTLHHAYVDMESILHHPHDSRHGLAYVALSRVRSLEGLVISNFIPEAIFCHPDVKAFV